MQRHTMSSSPNRFRSKPAHALSILLMTMLISSTFSLVSSSSANEHHASIAGCQIFPADNIWNYDISHLPVSRNSAKYIQSIKNEILQNDFGVHFPGFPYSVVPGTQPYVPVHFYYANESDPGPYPIPRNAPVESRSDRHVIVLDSSTCKLYEMGGSYLQPDGSWYAESGATWNLNSNALRPMSWTSADAAGLPILPGLVRYDEVATGFITHALRFAGANPQDTYVWPARHTDGISINPDSMPEGTRLRLKASVNISAYPPQARVILFALQHYGMFLADKGGDTHLALSGAPDPNWSEKDLSTLTNIHGSDFEVVDESSLQLSPDSAQVHAG